MTGVAPKIKIRGGDDAYTKDDLLGKKRLGPPFMVWKKIEGYLVQRQPRNIYPIILIFVELCSFRIPAPLPKTMHTLYHMYQVSIKACVFLLLLSDMKMSQSSKFL